MGTVSIWFASKAGRPLTFQYHTPPKSPPASKHLTFNPSLRKRCIAVMPPGTPSALSVLMPGVRCVHTKACTNDQYIALNRSFRSAIGRCSCTIWRSIRHPLYMACGRQVAVDVLDLRLRIKHVTLERGQIIIRSHYDDRQQISSRYVRNVRREQ